MNLRTIEVFDPVTADTVIAELIDYELPHTVHRERMSELESLALKFGAVDLEATQKARHSPAIFNSMSAIPQAKMMIASHEYLIKLKSESGNALLEEQVRRRESFPIEFQGRAEPNNYLETFSSSIGIDLLIAPEIEDGVEHFSLRTTTWNLLSPTGPGDYWKIRYLTNWQQDKLRYRHVNINQLAELNMNRPAAMLVGDPREPAFNRLPRSGQTIMLDGQHIQTTDLVNIACYLIAPDPLNKS